MVGAGDKNHCGTKQVFHWDFCVVRGVRLKSFFLILPLDYLVASTHVSFKINLENEHVPALGHGPHIDGVKDLVMGGALCAAHIGQLPLQIVLQVLHAVEGDLELEGAAKGRRVVEHHHIVDLHLRHGGREGFFIAPLEPSPSENLNMNL